MSDGIMIKPTQHCTNFKCYYRRSGFSHTAEWCGWKQYRRCACPYCYPEDQELSRLSPAEELEVKVEQLTLERDKIKEKVQELLTLLDRIDE